MKREGRQGIAGMRMRGVLASLAALIVVGVTISVGSASAEMQRSLIYKFGPDGTPTSDFPCCSLPQIAYDQTDHRIWLGGSTLSYLDMSNPLSPIPAGSPFPLRAWYENEGCPGVLRPQECPVSNHPWHGGNPTVDNSDTSSQGRFYATFNYPYWNTPTAQAEGIVAYEADGSQLEDPFPLETGEPGGPCWSAVDSNGVIAISNPDPAAMAEGRGVIRYTSSLVPQLPVDTQKHQDAGPCYLAFDSQDNLFVNAGNSIWKYTAASNYTDASKFLEVEKGSIGQQMTINKSNDHLLMISPDGLRIREYDPDGNLLMAFGYTYGVWTYGFLNVDVNEETNEVYVSDPGSGGRIEEFGPPVNVPKVTAESVDDVSTTGARLHGHIELDGASPVIECFFQYGLAIDYSEGEQPCTPEASPGSPIGTDMDVEAQLSGLDNQEAAYQYRLVVKTADGTAVGQGGSFYSTDPPLVRGGRIIEVTADHALLAGEINPRGIFGEWHIEFGPEPCVTSECESSDSARYIKCPLYFCPPSPRVFTEFSKELSGLDPGTLYHFRLVGENDQGGVTFGNEFIFRTFPLDPGGVDRCPNAHARKLSGAAKLSHCRGYELVSAADAGGYDVASNIVEGEEPLDAFPRASDRFLYTTSVGKLPGIAGFPVNLGTDPYVATRGANGWTTEYAGLAATLPSDSPFASTVSGADAGLTEYAFAEPDRCSPCFDDGSTGIPVRLSDGSLVQGMKGSLDVADPEPAGKVNKPFSADGDHFVFGSEQQFEPAGNSGSISIYDRNLGTSTTQVVSTMPNGATMTGEAAELDISADGSHILIGLPVSSDAQGNPRYDLYMHIGTGANSVLVADTTNGVLYNGMSDDGTKVYFSTDQSLADDADSSMDIFRADVGTSSASVTRVSAGTGGTGNSDACAPPDNWNITEGEPDCSALAFAGGAGVASGDGTIYFMSPELLDGPSNGVQDQPNIYVRRPGSSTTEFVGMLDSSLIKPPPSPPRRPVLETSFGGSHVNPETMAVDEATGAVYVIERNQGRFARYTAEGAPLLFTAGSGAGTNKIGGISTGGRFENGIAVDNAEGSPFHEAVYTINGGGTVNIYASNGEQLGAITGLYYACGVAVDAATGDVYVGDYSYPGIRKYHPVSAATPVTTANYVETSIVTQGMSPCQVAAGGGQAYASQWSEGPLRRYPMSAFESTPPSLLGKQIASESRTMYVDPSTGDVYVEQGKKVAVFSSDEEEEIPWALVGLGALNDQSRGVTVNGTNHHVYATKGNEIVHFSYEEVPYLLIDHPGALHAKEQSETHNSEDFQVTPSGDDAVFTSKVQLTEKGTDGNAQVYRYHAPDGELDCVSCTPTRAITTGNAFLTPNGSNVDDSGRVYFTSPEQLTLRDTNRRTDAYEWEEGPNEEGVLNLISTGTGVVNAALASVDSTGMNAYFFTRESIIPQDDNGQSMKVYTAREGGGYSYLPAGVPCQAADECRGPGTKVAPPPNIGTYQGSLGNVSKHKKKCRKGSVRRHGRCVKHSKANSKHKRSAHQHGRQHHG